MQSLLCPRLAVGRLVETQRRKEEGGSGAPCRPPERLRVPSPVGRSGGVRDGRLSLSALPGESIRYETDEKRHVSLQNIILPAMYARIDPRNQ